MLDRSLVATLLILLVGGCPAGPPASDDTDETDDTDDNPDDTPGETDTDTEDGFETDTDPFETGWGHTGVPGDTGDTDPDSSQPQPPDSGIIGIDTAICPFGEKQDCNGLCFPAYFIGDGTCDDGTTGAADFDCATYSFDNGDCSDDTFNGIPIDTDLLDGCPISIRTTTGFQGSTMGWEIRRKDGTMLYQKPAGSFMLDNTAYADSVLLDDDKYDFWMTDSFSDGWNNGSFIAWNPDGSIAAEGALAGGGAQAVEMDVRCAKDTAPEPPDPDACGDLEITVNTGRKADEVGWRIRDAANNIVGEATFGSYSDNSTATTAITLPTGYYTFNLRDLRGDGWNGADYTILDIGTQQTLAAGSLPTGTGLEQPFAVDCSDTFNPPPPPVPTDVSCQPTAVRARTALDGEEIGWELREAGTGALVDFLPPGGYGRNGTFAAPMLIGAGDWQLTLLDSANDGWEGDTMDIYDFNTGYVFGTWGGAFTAGGSWQTTFSTSCPGATTPPPPRPCSAGSVPDCNNVCWPRTMASDSFCDDGSTFAPNFNCERFDFDNGACAIGP